MSCTRVISELKGTRKGRLKYATESSWSEILKEQKQLEEAIDRFTSATVDIQQNPLVAGGVSKKTTVVSKAVTSTAAQSSSATMVESTTEEDRTYALETEKFVRQRLVKLQHDISLRLASLATSRVEHERKFKTKSDQARRSSRLLPPTSEQEALAAELPAEAEENDSPNTSMCNFLTADRARKRAQANDSMCNLLLSSPDSNRDDSLTAAGENDDSRCRLPPDDEYAEAVEDEEAASPPSAAIWDDSADAASPSSPAAPWPPQADYVALGLATCDSIRATYALVQEKLARIDSREKRANFDGLLNDLNDKVEGAEDLLREHPELGTNTLQQIDYEMKWLSSTVSGFLQTQSTDSLPSITPPQLDPKSPHGIADMDHYLSVYGDTTTATVAPADETHSSEDAFRLPATKSTTDDRSADLQVTSTTAHQSPPTDLTSPHVTAEPVATTSFDSTSDPDTLRTLTTATSVLPPSPTQSQQEQATGSETPLYPAQSQTQQDQRVPVTLRLVTAEALTVYEKAVSVLQAARYVTDAFDKSARPTDAKLRAELKMTVNGRVSQTKTTQTRKETQAQFGFLKKVLSGESFLNYKGNQMISADSNEVALYLQIFVIQRYLKLINSDSTLVGSVAPILLGLMTCMPGFADLFMGCLYEQCPLALAYYRADLLSVDIGGGAADRTAQIPRQTALLRLTAELASAEPITGGSTCVGLQLIWSTLADACNLPARPTLTALLLNQLLSHCHRRLSAVYGRQYAKLRALIATRLLPLLAAASSATGEEDGRSDGHAIAEYRRLQQTLAEDDRRRVA